MMMMRNLTARLAVLAGIGLAVPLAAAPATAAPLCDKLGFAGLLAKCNRGEPIEITLASGQPLGKGDVALQSGAYYEMKITADGSAELGISGAAFFRAIWMNEIVINGIEIRPMAIDSLEFDKAGVATMSFIALKPGTYEVRIPNTTSDTQKVTISIQ
jgi:hypothetical protein